VEKTTNCTTLEINTETDALSEANSNSEEVVLHAQIVVMIHDEIKDIAAKVRFTSLHS
jgi:hypothetical protein